MSKYERMRDGEAYQFDKGDILRFACCDCGMVHDLRFITTRKYAYFSATQRPRSTAQLRRNRYGKLHNRKGKWQLKELK